MSTRCNIILKDRTGTFYLYHHCDGYPEGVGAFLVNKIGDFVKKGNYLPYEIANYLIKDKDDDSYELTCCVHGDIEYLYEADLEKKTLRCWKYDGWNGKKIKEIDLSKINEEA